MKLIYIIESFNTIGEFKRRSIDVEVKKMSPRILESVVKLFRTCYPDDEIIRVYLDRIEYTSEDLKQ